METQQARVYVTNWIQQRMFLVARTHNIIADHCFAFKKFSIIAFELLLRGVVRPNLYLVLEFDLHFAYMRTYSTNDIHYALAFRVDFKQNIESTKKPLYENNICAALLCLDRHG